MPRAAILLFLALALPAADDGPDIRAWVVENTRLDDGSRRASALFLWHRTTAPDGTVSSSHLLNWVQAGDDRMLVPLWFGGPGYDLVPPALSASWTRDDGGSSTWITPLYHADRDAQGRLEDMHLLAWAQGGDWEFLFPLYYRHGGQRGLVPAWFSGADWWSVPLALSGGWTRDDGGSSLWLTPLFHADRDRAGRPDGMHLGPWFQGPDHAVLFPLFGRWHDAGGSSTWITPLFHVSRDAAGATTSLHALNWLHSPDRDIVLPLAWLDHGPRGTTGVVLPLWAGGEDWWALPPLLSAGWRSGAGGRSTWLTPLHHRSTAADGSTVSRHTLNWFSGAGADGSSWQTLFPLWWHDRAADGATRSALLPLWLDGPDWTLLPPLLSGGWRERDGAATTWITPLFHRTVEADGSLRSLHAGLWWQDASRQALVPFWWSWGGEQARHRLLLPLWYDGPEATVVPPLLSWRRRTADGGSSTWITPLFHRDTDAQGATTSMHALNWIRSGGTDMLLPFWYRTPSSFGILPLWLQDEAGWTAPPLLSWQRRHADGSDTTWITPLAHVSRDAGGAVTSLHALNWFQWGDRRLLFPIAWQGGGSQGIIPLAFSGDDWWALPPLLSAGWTRADGGSSTWITPLWHHDRAADGSLLSLHAGPWIQGRDWRMLVPLGWQGADGWAAPALLSAGWMRADGGSSTWITPLYHHDRAADGAIASLHALTWWQDGSGSGLLPLWWHGTDATIVPPLLSGHWRRRDGGSSTWITPLFHRGADAQGRTTDWHALNVVHGDGTTVVAPLWYDVQGATGRHRGLVPLWFSGPDWWAAPLGLAAGWSDGDRSTSFITPLYHRSREDGRTTSMHLLTWIATPDLETVAPLWWDWRSDAGTRHRLLVPLWWQREDASGFSAAALPLGFNYRSGAAVDTSLETQLWPFRVQNAADGHEVSVLWRLFHLRERRGTSEVQLWPLWWSEHRDGEPMGWQLLGGLFGRDVDRAGRTTLDYAAWDAVRFGGRTAYGAP